MAVFGLLLGQILKKGGVMPLMLRCVVAAIVLLAFGGCSEAPKSALGESCEKTADCVEGARCIQQACVAKGASGKAKARSKKKRPPGKVTIDGSGTVFPLSEAVAEEFGKGKKVKLTVGRSGTGGGMKKFCAGKADITGASRSMSSSEKELCAKNNIEFIELPVALDGISVVVPKDSFIKSLTTDELKRIWSPASEGKVTKWNQVNSSFPDEEIALFGPGLDSGTFDVFTQRIVGKTQSSRGDYTSSMDYNSLVRGISMTRGALGYVGFAYYQANKNKIKAVAITDEGKAVMPSMDTISDGSYTPLTRTLFIYVNRKSAERPDVEAIVTYYLGEGLKLARDVGYIPLPDAMASEANKRFAKRVIGTRK